MVMTKTVTKYGRRRYSRRYRRYRHVSNVYFPCRVEGVYTIAFPNTESGGGPIFAENGQLTTVSFCHCFKLLNTMVHLQICLDIIRLLVF